MCRGNCPARSRRTLPPQRAAISGTCACSCSPDFPPEAFDTACTVHLANISHPNAVNVAILNFLRTLE
jgi:hypothetical protein